MNEAGGGQNKFIFFGGEGQQKFWRVKIKIIFFGGGLKIYLGRWVKFAIWVCNGSGQKKKLLGRSKLFFFFYGGIKKGGGDLRLTF